MINIVSVVKFYIIVYRQRFSTLLDMGISREFGSILPYNKNNKGIFLWNNVDSITQMPTN